MDSGGACIETRVFQLLQEHGADPNQPLLGISGDMPRRYSGEDTMVRLIRFLADECGADPNCKDDEGLTPLALACREGHRKIAAALLDRGAETHTDAPDWAQPVTLAANHGHTELAETIRRHV